MKISKRRVEQVWKKYSETGKEPVLGKNLGRPEQPLDPREMEIVKIAFERYKFGAAMLEPIIDGFYEMHIPHNRIHKILLSEGLAKEEESKKKRRKWIRYERKHSLSAGHIDWHEVDMTDIKLCVILDDASRKVLAGGEFTTIDTENAKKVIDQLVDRYWIICPMRKLPMEAILRIGIRLFGI